MKASTEILLNATLVTQKDYSDTYEFILGDNLYVKECVRVESLAEGIVFPVLDFKHSLKDTLFELNHVRVNPNLDNTQVISTVTQALLEIGVSIHKPPAPDSMAMCFKPLGEISDNVRLVVESDGKVVFLASTGKLRVIRNLRKAPPAQPTL